MVLVQINNGSDEVSRTRWLRMAAMILLFAASLVTVEILRVQPGGYLVFWLPQGVMVGSLVMFDRKDCLILLLIFVSGIFVAGVAGGDGVALSLSAALVRSSGAAATAWLYRTIEGRKLPTENTRALAVFIGAAILGCTFAGTTGAYFEMQPSAAGYDQSAIQWSLATLLATLSTAPAMLAWASASGRGAWIHLNLELDLILAGMALSASLIFLASGENRFLPLSSVFVLMPCLIWAALRRPDYESATLILVALVIAKFAIDKNIEDLAAGQHDGAMYVNWIISTLLLLTTFTQFLVVKTREKNLAAELLNEREIRFDAVFHTSPDGVIVIDRRGIVEAYNSAAEKLFGYRADEVIGRNVKMLMPPYLAERHDGYISRYLETGERRIIGIGRVVTGQRRDGSTFPIELAIGEALINGKRLFTGFVRDLTEKQGAEQRIHELQNELMHSARLASLGEISSTIAHEVNQPLSAAGTYMQVAEELTRSGRRDAIARAVDSIAKAATQVKRAGDIIRRVRDFAKKRAPELALEDINRVIEEACALAFVGTKDSGIKGNMDLSADLPPILIDKIQIQQVIVNLVRNSIDAMGAGHTGQIGVRSRFSGADSIEVSVIDNGPGVAEELRDNLFVPFATTKIAGTGLGLAVCKSIVEAHQGRLWYAPNPSGGAIFTFTLPLTVNSPSRT
jgi:two-component system sensor kinase FixL